ncbi:DUF4062 domain-containing protein [Winogradskyella forsetii]|uniref:DUF4062 domain-containing protein n=1 Tax=Winogradskyella forsetii TaxID=2686077 RepID=UPI0015BD9C4C|nr:DUF4062 domain-containing protein [Winogradskyella forsetii]
MAKKKQKIKVMIASTVYGFENELSAIVAQLSTLKYDVINSHHGTVKVNPNLSNLDNCLKAVEECDFFVGIIRPYYGTGNIDDLNITFEEIKTAIKLGKPYWFLVHRDVVFSRLLLGKIECKDGKGYIIKKNRFFDERSIDIYNHVIKDGEPVALRNGNWAQEFYRLDEAMTYIQAQFGDKEFIESLIKDSEDE